MATNERREYIKKWRMENRERIKEQRQAKARAEALAAVESIRRLDMQVFVIRANDGHEYIVGGRE